jgi:hypothetical protein
VIGAPRSISVSEQQRRIRRVTSLCAELGFVGNIEYRHVYSQSGGAQYCIGPTADDDIMVLYAEAFERDANPEDYDLEALIAHECGHQRLHRDANLRSVLDKFPGDHFEEILASLVGSILLGGSGTAQTLVLKATAELTDLGVSPDHARGFLERLERLLRQLL